MKSFSFILKILTVFLLISVTLLAEVENDSLEVYESKDVVITGNKAIRGISPIPFANIPKKKIERIYMTDDMPELLTELPSTMSYSESGNNIGYSYLSMRGFDQHRIAVFVNGIPQNDPEDHNVYWIDLPDLAASTENIQVQRGAGIVNYGAAAIGGSINITTMQHSKERSVKLFSGIGWQEYGSNNTYQPNVNKYSIEAASGKIDNISIFARLSKINSNGYRDNMWVDLNSYYLSVAHFGEQLTTHINVFGGPISDGLGYYGLPKEYIGDKQLRRKNPSWWQYDDSLKNVIWFTPRREQEAEEFSQPHYEMFNKWVGNGYIFESSLFYYSGKGYFDYDGTWADEILTGWVSNDYQFQGIETFRNSIIRGTVSNKQGGWIPKLFIEHPGGNLSVGAEIRFHRSQHYGEIIYSENLPSGYDPDYKFYYNEGIRNVFSIFASENFNLTDKLSLNIQGQLVNQVYQMRNIKQGSDYMKFTNIEGETVDSDGNPLFDISYIFFNPRLGLNYNLNDNINIYLMGAYTSREPRMKNLLAAEEFYYGAIPQFESEYVDSTYRYDFSKPLVKPESMIDIEFGSNYKSTDYSFGFNFYWMDYKDELVSTGVLDIWGRPVDGNVPETRHIGLELQGAANVLKSHYGNITVSANATLSSNKIMKFNYKVNDTLKFDLSDNEIAGFPTALLKGRVNYNYEGFWASISGRYVAEYRTDNFRNLLKDESVRPYLADYKDNIVEPYFLLNFDFSYTFDEIGMFKYIKIKGKVYNVLNKLFATHGIGRTFFPGAERNFFFGLECGF